MFVSGLESSYKADCFGEAGGPKNSWGLALFALDAAVGFLAHVTTHGFYLDIKDSNLGRQAWAPSTLPAEPAPQPAAYIFVSGFCICLPS